MSELRIQKKQDGYWLLISGKISAAINIVSNSPLVMKAIEEAVSENTIDALRAELAAEKEKITEATELIDAFLGDWVNVEYPFLPVDMIPFRDIKEFLEGDK